jgi:TonB family protein
MPIFEPPPSPDPELQRAPLPLSNSPYAGLEHHELLQLIDELNDERARARFREGIWIAFFLHLLIFAALYFIPSWLFHGVKVINPIDAMQDHDKQIYLNMPQEMEKQASKPRPATRALDQKTIQQLQQMQHEAPPPPPETEAKNEPQLPMPETPRPQPDALPDMPMPQTRPSTPENNDDQFSSQIQNLAHAAAGGDHGGMVYGNNAAPNQKGLGAGMEILTDTQGVDFNPWLQKLHYIIQTAWEPLIPESVYPPLNKRGVVGIRFTIGKDGKLEHIVLETPSGDVALDKAAWGAIVGPQPFPPLPKEFPGKEVEIRGGFFYNVAPN